MDFTDNFNKKLWSKADANSQEGFQTYKIAKSACMKDGSIGYYVFDDEGDVHQLRLLGSATKKNPLDGVGTAEFKVSETKEIIGVRIEDDCLVYNG